MQPDDAVLRQAIDPATAAERLRQLAAPENDPAVRAAVARNPNTPTETLIGLIIEFPEAFLANPVLPLLLVEHPDLTLRLPDVAQLALLRCATMPMALLRPLVDLPARGRRSLRFRQPRPFIPPSVQFIRAVAAQHILIAGEAPDATWPAEVQDLVLRDLMRHKTWPSAGLATLPGVLPPWLIEMLWAHKVYAPALSASPDLTNEQRTSLAADPTATHALALATQTQPEILHTLLPTTDGKVQRAIAHHPRATPAILAALSQEHAAGIRRAVAYNPHTAPTTLAHLATDADETVRIAVAKHPRTPPTALAQLALDVAWHVRASVAANRHTPISTLERCAVDAQPEVRALVARHPCAPIWLLEGLAARGAAAAEWALAHRRRMGHVAEGDFADALARRDFDLLRDLARDASAPHDVLARLALHEDRRVRQAVAQNRHAPVATLRALADDADPHVRQAVAANGRAPLAALEVLAAPAQPEHVRLAVARNPAAPFDLLAALVEGASYTLCHAVVYHQHVGRARRAVIYRRFFTWALEHDSADGFVRGVALAGIDLPAAIFAQAARSYNWTERLLMTHNPSAPAAVLTHLTEDGDRTVRASARAALAARNALAMENQA
jgi:hypothetical protein